MILIEGDRIVTLQIYDDEREEFQRLLEDDGYEEVIENILNDDETWRVIDDSLEYYITHLK